MGLEESKVLLQAVATVIALFTVIRGVLEYARSNAQKRAELFFALRKRFDESAGMRRIRAALDAADDKLLKSIAKSDKIDFLTFYEDVALLMNSKLMREPNAHYMFGFYAIEADGSAAFWTSLNRDLAYWSVFRDFAERMKARGKELETLQPESVAKAIAMGRLEGLEKAKAWLSILRLRGRIIL